MSSYVLMRKQRLLVIQYETAVHSSAPTPTLTTSLKTPPVTKTGQPPKETSPTSKRTFKKKTSTDAKDETGDERSVTAGILAKIKPSTHKLLSSQPMSHSSFSQKNDVSNKGQVTSVGDNTLFAGVTSLATDPSHLSSLTAPAVNVFLQSQGEIQADPSVFNDPLAKTQADDDEKTNHLLQKDQTFAAAFHAIIKGEKYSVITDATREMLIYFVQLSRGRKCANECKNQCCSCNKSLILGNHIIFKIADAVKVTDTWKSYHKTYIFPVFELQFSWRFYSIFVPLQLSNESFSIRISYNLSI